MQLIYQRANTQIECLFDTHSKDGIASNYMYIMIKTTLYSSTSYTFLLTCRSEFVPSCCYSGLTSWHHLVQPEVV